MVGHRLVIEMQYRVVRVSKSGERETIYEGNDRVRAEDETFDRLDQYRKLPDFAYLELASRRYLMSDWKIKWRNA